MTQTKRISPLIYLILFVNVFDIIIHVGSGQPEAMRITSNVFIIVSSLLFALNNRYRPLFTVSLALYVLLNALYVVMNGIGAIGVVLIAVTIFSGIFILRNNTKKLPKKL